MAIQFGEVYEKPSNRLSIEVARAYFFRVLSESRRTAIVDLRDTAVPPFAQFITDNSEAINQLTEEAEIEHFSTAKEQLIRVYRRFIPDWKALPQAANSQPLQQALQEWAGRWNLSGDWILDQAITYLAIFWGRRDEADSPEYEIRQSYLLTLTFDAWRDAIAEWDSNADGEAFNSVVEVELDPAESDLTLPDFNFKLKGLEFSRRSGASALLAPEQWAEIAMEDFREYLRRKRDNRERIPISAIDKFPNVLKQHIRKIKSIAKERGYVPPPSKEGSDHFIWLIDYQIPEALYVSTKTYDEIAVTYGKPKRTIADGINRAAGLLDLVLRNHKPGRKRGQISPRKLSKREADRKTSRLCRAMNAISQVGNPEIKKDVANKVGISPSQFRRAWIPDILKQAQEMLGVRHLTYTKFIQSHTQEKVAVALSKRRE